MATRDSQVEMGLASELAEYIRQASNLSLFATLSLGSGALIVLVVVLNVLNQLLFKNPKEPPVVFHWFPFIGSTITYGIHPYKFFFACQEKV